ncbi:mitochondrial ribosomal protein S30 [Lycorma delicatula]|uniref:mitochondrial ribosomal protein S30 n=1 Tax=Lycorma delicatula TaxID=130591 RepID=UPI003F513A1B
MFPACKSKIIFRLLKTYGIKKYRYCRHLSSAVEEYAKPNYPPIEDLSPAALKKKERFTLHEKYRKLNTIEEKLMALNFPRYWGWETIVLKEGELPYNFLPFAKYVTRTHFKETLTLPLNNCTPDIDPKDLVNVIKSQIQDAILFELFERRHRHELEPLEDIDEVQLKNFRLNSIINQINRILTVNLIQYVPQLIHAEVDYNPRLEAFWKVGGFKWSEEEHKIRTEKLDRDDIPFEWKNEAGKELEHWFQYFGETILQLRSQLPLEPVTDDLKAPVDLKEIISSEVRYSPDFHGLGKKRRFGTSVPGFWPGNDTNEFGLLSYHSCNHLSVRPPHFGIDEHNEAIHAQAILAAYSWLHGLASYQGFSTFNEMVYPLVTQHVITDGQSFSFYLYQLNTMLMHQDYYESNERCNLCYGTPRIKLYDHVKGREFVGWNDDVILRLISMYMNKTAKRNYDMKPFVNPNESYVSEVTDIDERREWLHNEFRYMYSNRPREKLPYEIFDWEWIYKIKFMTRPMDRRIRPFELWQHPITERKYNDYLPRYIPKSLRDPLKRKQKNCNTYFPDAF